MRIGVVAMPGCYDSGLAVLVDIVHAAERLRSRVDPAIDPLTVRIIGTAATVRTGNGARLAPEHVVGEAGLLEELDVIVVPGLGIDSVAGLNEALARPQVRRLRHWLASAGRLPEVAAACSSTFVAAETGLLDGRSATTCWWLADEFRRRHPAVDLDMSRMVVQSGPVTTAGAAFAHIDLGMVLVGKADRGLADAVSRYLLIDRRPSLSLDAVTTHLAAADPLVSEFEAWARAHLEETFTVAEAARAIGTTRRTLERRTGEHAGLTPLALLTRLRLEQAVHLQRTSGLSLDQIAHRVGYGSGATLRRRLRALP